MVDMEHQKEIVTTMLTKSLMQDLRQIIEQARGHVAATANYALTTMYWHIGERINREILGNPTDGSLTVTGRSFAIL